MISLASSEQTPLQVFVNNAVWGVKFDLSLSAGSLEFLGWILDALHAIDPSIPTTVDGGFTLSGPMSSAPKHRLRPQQHCILHELPGNPGCSAAASTGGHPLLPAQPPCLQPEPLPRSR